MPQPTFHNHLIEHCITVIILLNKIGDKKYTKKGQKIDHAKTVSITKKALLNHRK